MAAYANRRKMIGCVVIELQRGEVLASLRYLATRWRWSTKKVLNFLSMLVEMETLRKQRETPEGNIYLLVNYRRYQREGNGEETPAPVEKKQPGNTWETAGKHLGNKGEEGEEGEQPPPTQDARVRERLPHNPDLWMQAAWQRIRPLYPPHAMKGSDGERAFVEACARSLTMTAEERSAKKLSSIRPDGTPQPDERSRTVTELAQSITGWSMSGQWKRLKIPNLRTFLDNGIFCDPPPPPEREGREDPRRSAGAHQPGLQGFDPFADEKGAA